VLSVASDSVDRTALAVSISVAAAEAAGRAARLACGEAERFDQTTPAVSACVRAADSAERAARHAVGGLDLSERERSRLMKLTGMDRAEEFEKLRREMARTAGGPGAPEAIWDRYREECGPLARMDDDCLRQLYYLHLDRAWGAGVSELRFPPEIEARLVKGRPRPRGRGKPSRSFFIRRFEHQVIAAVVARKEALKAEGIKADEALERALEEATSDVPWPKERLEDWVKHPGRRQGPRVRARRAEPR
jgi:hypothetical protein